MPFSFFLLLTSYAARALVHFGLHSSVILGYLSTVFVCYRERLIMLEVMLRAGGVGEKTAAATKRWFYSPGSSGSGIVAPKIHRSLSYYSSLARCCWFLEP